MTFFRVGYVSLVIRYLVRSAENLTRPARPRLAVTQPADLSLSPAYVLESTSVVNSDIAHDEGLLKLGDSNRSSVNAATSS
jgi:hypothetical protein